MPATLDISKAFSFKDDGPTARPDVDFAAAGGTTGGNVMLGTDSDVVGALNNAGAKLADSQGADGASLASAQFGANAAVSTFDGSGNLNVVGQWGTLHIKADGTYLYTANPDNNPTDYSPKTDVFNYTVRDRDGDTSATTLTINVIDPVLVVGKNVDDTPPGTTPHQVDVTPDTPGTITGRGTDDVLIGDVGGARLLHKSANVVLILDTSGSMATDFNGNSINYATNPAIGQAGHVVSRMEALQAGVDAMLDRLFNSGADAVRVHINHFSDTVLPGTNGTPGNTNTGALGDGSGTFDLITKDASGVIHQNAAGLAAAKAFVDGLGATGYTNYEAGLQEALNYIQPLAGSAALVPLTGLDVVNQAVFVSDGQPNRALGGTIDPATGHASLASSNIVNYADNQTGYDQALRELVSVSGTGPTDNTNEPALIESSFGRLDAIGVALPNNPDGIANLARLSTLEGSATSPGGNDGAVNASNATQFQNALLDTSPTSSLSAVGGDSISGGGGNDLFFGDTLNTDVLGAARNLGLSAGSGWAVFQTLEANSTPANPWTRATTLQYIKDNPDALAVESTGAGGVHRNGARL